MQPKILNKDTFSKEVENFVLASNGSYIDAVVWLCQEQNIEVETAAKLLSPHVKTMIEAEADQLNLLTIKKNQLDFEDST